VIGEATPDITGFLEVTLVQNDKLLHSKKNGQGYVDTQAKIDKIIAGIKEYIASKK